MAVAYTLWCNPVFSGQIWTIFWKIQWFFCSWSCAKNLTFGIYIFNKKLFENSGISSYVSCIKFLYFLKRYGIIVVQFCCLKVEINICTLLGCHSILECHRWRWRWNWRPRQWWLTAKGLISNCIFYLFLFTCDIIVCYVCG